MTLQKTGIMSNESLFLRCVYRNKKVTAVEWSITRALFAWSFVGLTECRLTLETTVANFWRRFISSSQIVIFFKCPFFQQVKRYVCDGNFMKYYFRNKGTFNFKILRANRLRRNATFFSERFCFWTPGSYYRISFFTTRNCSKICNRGGVKKMSSKSYVTKLCFLRRKTRAFQEKRIDNYFCHGVEANNLLMLIKLYLDNFFASIKTLTLFALVLFISQVKLTV